MKLLLLAYVFARIGLFTVGGGMAMLPLIRQEMLRHAWLTESEFLEILGIAEVTPGPLAVNAATFVGWRIAGIPGALTATLALMAPALLGILLLGYVWRRHKGHVLMDRIMAVLRPVVTALILAAALRLLLVVLNAGNGISWTAATVAALVCGLVTWGRINPILVLLGGAMVGALLVGVPG